ncbi:hypothetical protein EMPS_11451 [Entomortierella parvispora]|uniref:C2H2-type domain-containing protein n=1 Tax=Entomortierella parvispora TaxID=205924 RepID=A0A9P3HLX5_9FUNG|nr:hypothetical protein EMPS_11451 [Entomortierella parvispora]
MTTFQSSMDTLADRRRSSVKSLMGSANPPASPLDALVLALEATAEEMNGMQDQDLFATRRPLNDDDEEDPNATVPSSPTVFMKRSADTPSLQQLPSLVLPEAAVSTLPEQTCAVTAAAATLVSASFVDAAASGLTPSTHPSQVPSGQAIAHRKMSTSSQASVGSVSSTNSSGERTKEFACTIGSCEKKFYQVAHLRIHERCHTGTRPFVCRFDGCERSFTQLGNLKTHERKHTGERPYSCPHPGCSKTFTQLGNLKTHERIHDEVKPFMCRLAGCGKTFSQLGNLKTHTVKMHPDVAISDEELAIRTTASSPQMQRAKSPSPVKNAASSSPAPRLVKTKEHPVVQVITHFNPYQRRPIKPQQSEEQRLLKQIRAMIQHQQRVRQFQDGSEVSDDMEE